MHVSLSEIEATVAKAVMAVGLPLGLAEDAGRAAKLMLGSGFGALADLVDALDAVDSGASAGFESEAALSGTFVPANGARQLSALRAGPSACDLLMAAAGAADGHGTVALSGIDCPTVVLHDVLERSGNMDAAVSVAWSMDEDAPIEIVCQDGRASLRSGTPADISAGGPADMTISIVGSAGDHISAGPSGGDGAEAEDAAWRRLSAYAERRLVESTEESRLSGAGAGVVDRD